MKASATLICSRHVSNQCSNRSDDADDVKAAEMDFRAKESAGNVDGYFACRAPTYSLFPATGGLISGGQSKVGGVMGEALWSLMQLSPRHFHCL